MRSERWPSQFRPTSRCDACGNFFASWSNCSNGWRLYDTFLIPGRHHEAFRAAWIDVRPRIGEVVKQLDRPAASNRADLKDLGLTGNQLAFKLGIFQHAHDELVDYRAQLPRRDEDPGPPVGWGKRAFARLWTRTLKAADVILDSLAQAFPPLHAVKELKESAESGLALGAAAGEAIGEMVKPKK